MANQKWITLLDEDDLVKRCETFKRTGLTDDFEKMGLPPLKRSRTEDIPETKFDSVKFEEEAMNSALTMFGKLVPKFIQSDAWKQAMAEARKMRSAEDPLTLNVISVPDTSVVTFLPFPLKYGTSVQVLFIGWNPLSPPAIPAGASVLWLECAEMVSLSGFSPISTAPIIATWNLAGTVFQGEQPTFPLQDKVYSNLGFKLWTNLGQVPVVSGNGLIITLAITNGPN